MKIHLKGNLEQIWNGPVTAWVLTLASAVVAFWANVHLPLPGISIAVLGAMAAVMSLRPNMPLPEKAAWMVLIGAMLTAEIRSIRSDRSINDLEQSGIQKKENDRFDEIVRRLEESINKNKQQYESTIRQVNGVLTTTKGVAEIAKQNLNSVVGGRSFIYAEFLLPSQCIRLGKQGSAPLYDVSLRIVVNKPIANGTRVLDDTFVELGNFPAGDRSLGFMDAICVEQIPGFRRRLILDPKEMDIALTFQARNGVWSESQHMLHVPDPKSPDAFTWERAIRVYRYPPAGGKGELIYENVPEGYPPSKIP